MKNKQNLFFLLMIIILSSSSLSCRKEKADQEDGQYFMQYKVNGELKVERRFCYASISPLENGDYMYTFMSKESASAIPGLTILAYHDKRIQSPLEMGVPVRTNNNMPKIDIVYYINTLTAYTSLASVVPAYFARVTITEIDGRQVRGKFSGKLRRADSQEDLELTEGEFFLKFAN